MHEKTLVLIKMSELTEDQLTALQLAIGSWQSTRDKAFIAQAFALMDRNGNGSVDANEFRTVFSQMLKRCVPEDVAEAEIKRLDTDKSGALDLNEFTRWFDRN